LSCPRREGMCRSVTALFLKVGTEWRCFVDRVFLWNGSIMDNIIYSGYFYCDICPTVRSRSRDCSTGNSRFVSGTYHHRSRFFPPSKVCVLAAIVLKVLNRVFLRCFYEHNSAQVKTFGETTNHAKSQQLCDTELVSGVIAWFDVASQLL